MAISPLTLGKKQRWLELAALGRDAWNIWASEELKKPLQQRSTVNLDREEIKHIDFSGFIFPGNASFREAKFPKHAYFSRSHFVGDAEFGDASFLDAATFQGTKFSGTAGFHPCAFKGAATFHAAEFAGPAFFNASEIFGFAHFNEVRFADRVEFSAVQFHNSAIFSQTRFLSDARFINTQFSSAVDFESTTFEQLAWFEHAEFVQPPALDASTFKHPPVFLDARFRFHRSQYSHARYRRLKKFAVDAHDHNQELDLFALETAARRGYALKWHRPSDWMELALNCAYGFASDYGRSVLRPAFALFIVFVAGAGALDIIVQACRLPWAWPGSVWRASLLNLFPFAGQSAMGRQVMERELCPQIRGASDLTCLTKLYEVSVSESVLAIIFLFLLILGIRNVFRIK